MTTAIAHARLKSGATSCNVLVNCDPSIRGAFIAQSLIDSGKLTTHHYQIFTQDLHETIAHITRLTPPEKNPFLSPEDRNSLDKTGLIRSGEITRPQGTLASILRLHTPNMLNRGSAEKGFLRASDDSLNCPDFWSGAIVTSATADAKDVSIQLERFVPIAVGDLLCFDNSLVIISGITNSAAAEIFVDPQIGRALLLAPGQSRTLDVFVAEDSGASESFCRAVGSYSLISQFPLAGITHRPGQILATTHVHTLQIAGLRHTLAELLTLKASDVGNRSAVNAAFQNATPFPTPGAPLTLHWISCLLTTLGLRPTFASAGDHLQMKLSIMTDADRLALSSGCIKKPETIYYRTYAPEPGGLFCEKVFGPENKPRVERFGHIELPSPVVHAFWTLPGPDKSPSPLATLLNLADENLAGLLANKLWLTIENDTPVFHSTKFEAEEKSPGQPPPTAVDAVLAIHQLACKKNPAIRDLSELISAKTILMLPPDFRPLVYLSSGNFATSDLNDLYRSVITRANRLYKLKDLNAPAVILDNEHRMLQRSCDSLLANNLQPDAAKFENRKLRDVVSAVLDDIQNEPDIRVDYSASARAIPTAPPDCALLPARWMHTLKLNSGDPVLLTRPQNPGEPATPMITLRAASHDHSAIALPAAPYDHLFANIATTHICVLHRPLTPEAVGECTANLGRPLLPVVTTIPEDAWYSDSPQQLLANFFAAAISSQTLSLASPRSLLFAGPGNPTLTPRADSANIEDEPRAPKTIDIPEF